MIILCACSVCCIVVVIAVGKVSRGSAREYTGMNDEQISFRSYLFRKHQTPNVSHG